jgi:Tol biopolymer transport system component
MKKRMIIGISLSLLIAIGCGLVALVLRTSTNRASVSKPVGTIAVKGGSGFRSVLVISPQSGVVRKIAVPDAVYGLDISPNGRKIAWTGDTGIWIMNSDGSDATRISRIGASQVEWSPSARQLLIGSDGALIVMSTSGKVVRRVTRHAEAADWWPGTHKLIFVHNPEQSSRNGVISSIRIGGQDVRRLVRSGQWYGPHISPDGKRVVFYRAGVSGVNVASLRSGKPQLLIRNGSQPEWSPDGRYIAFTRNVHCGEGACTSRVFIVSSSGGKARPYGPLIGDIGGLSWGR